MNLLCKVDPVQLCPLPAWPPVLYSLHSPKLFSGNDESEDDNDDDVDDEVDNDDDDNDEDDDVGDGDDDGDDDYHDDHDDHEDDDAVLCSLQSPKLFPA